MYFFTKWFNRNPKPPTSPIPSRETMVEIMYDKHLDAFSEEVVRVIYSIDRSMRYVVLKNEKGYFTYQLEAIYQYEEDEWKYLSAQEDVLPALWEPFRGIVGKSIFENMDDLLKEIKAEAEFKHYFL